MTTMTRPLPTGLARFRRAQDHHGAYRRALREISQGVKRTHWMWFVFPQLRGLAKSDTARYFGIADRAEAYAYLSDPVLRLRLAECASGVLRQTELMFSRVDTYKLRSSMTLFGQVAEDPTLANAVLEKFFDGKPDQLTLDLLAGKPIVLPESRPTPRPVATGRFREQGVQRARAALDAAERRRRAQEPWSRDRVSTFLASFGGLSTVAVRQMTDAWMADRQSAMKMAWESCADSFDQHEQEEM